MHTTDRYPQIGVIGNNRDLHDARFGPPPLPAAIGSSPPQLVERAPWSLAGGLFQALGRDSRPYPSIEACVAFERVIG
jgi:hypothetical protein